MPLCVSISTKKPSHSTAKKMNSQSYHRKSFSLIILSIMKKVFMLFIPAPSDPLCRISP